MEDIHISLDKDQQLLIAKWAIKTAMAAESFNRKTRDLFFTRDECARFRQSWTFPPHTLICMGRYVGRNIDVGVFGADAWDNKPTHPEVTHSYINTFVFRRVVIQVVCVHARKDLQEGVINFKIVPGPWRQSLIELGTARNLAWPPDLSFSDDGSLPLDRLLYRFSPEEVPLRPEDFNG